MAEATVVELNQELSGECFHCMYGCEHGPPYSFYSSPPLGRVCPRGVGMLVDHATVAADGTTTDERGAADSPMSTEAPILSFFWDLASVDASKRVHAGDLLLQALTKSQGQKAEPSADLTYTVKRLVRGL
eukprot:1768157-Prymnesium_polylepis.1